MIEYSTSSGICVLRLHNPPQNALTLDLLRELGAGLARAEADPEVCGIIVTGRADHFSAGADVNLFHEIRSSDEAEQLSRVFQEAFAKVEDAAKPTVAAVAGHVMGGALELALACHYRVCVQGSRFCMPEVKLAINPGAGGTQRLPRLIGLQAALDMLLSGRTVNADQALDMGLMDRVCPATQLLEAAGELLHASTDVPRTRLRMGRIADVKANDKVLQMAQASLPQGRKEIIAPGMILAAVRVGLEDSFEAGLRQEQTGFAACMETLATRNKLYLFFATRKTDKVLELKALIPQPLKKAAVVGAGTMGTGIAQALAGAGLHVHILDVQAEAAERAMQRIQQSLTRQVQRGRRTEQQMLAVVSRLTCARSWSDLAQMDLVVEAVFEQAEPKRSALTAIEAVCREDTIIASNTSTMDLEQLGATLRHPQRLIGLHFFNPAQTMPLVEVIWAGQSAPQVLATAMGLVKAMRKTPVLVKNSTGFIVNRLFIPYLTEAFQLLEEGAEAQAIDAAMREFGFAMGPLTLIDMAGLDILVLTDVQMCQAFTHHLPVSRVARALVAQGCLGQKTGAGVYSYEKGDYTPRQHDSTRDIIAQVQADSQQPARVIDADEITDRLVLRMVGEAFRVLEEGIAQRESDIDVAMVMGTGFPDFRGGVLKYAHDMGVDKIVQKLDALAGRCGARFRPCALMRTNPKTGV